MNKKVTDKELEIVEFLCNPISLIENLIPENFDAPHTWDHNCKCIIEGTPILLSNFTEKAIEDIDIGDEIFSFGHKKHNFYKNLVTNKINSGIKNVLKITTKKGKELICTYDHKILARTENRSQWLWLNAENLLNRYIVTIPETISNLKDYYEGQLFGFIDSDGSYYRYNNKDFLVIYQKTELKAVEYLLNKLNLNYYKYHVKDGNYSFRLKFKTKNEVSTYYNYLLNKLNKNNKDYELGYLVGFILGDGNYDKKNAHWNISQKKVKQIGRIEYFLKKYNLLQGITKWKKNNIYSYYISKNALPFLNPESIKIKYWYKSNRDKKTNINKNWIDKVIKIELLGKKQCWDLSTESHTFIANKILVHNCISFHNYQTRMVSYDSLYADDYKLDPRQNFLSKKGASDFYGVGGRNLGKTLFAIDFDSIASAVTNFDGQGCLSSFDAYHLNKRTERISNIIEGHKFFKMFHLKGQKKTINRGHNFAIRYRSGYQLVGANENINGKNIGKQYHGLHFKRFYYDEFSYSTEKGAEKRVDSRDPKGTIERVACIPELRVGSPLGNILKDQSKRNWLWRLPQSVRPDWDEEAKKEAIKKYGGKHTVAYKLNVEAEMIEGAFGRFDIDRIRENCLNQDAQLRRFEVGKENYKDFDKVLQPVNRMPAKQIFIASDIGTTGSPSEIIIIFGEPKHYKYRYNISLFNLTTQEQAKVFKWIFDKLGSSFISLDCSGADGRSIADELELLGVPKQYIIRCSFNANIVIGHEKHEDGRIKLNEHGNVLQIKEKQIVWACQRLDILLYNGYLDIPEDNKFFNQFSGYLEFDNNGKKKYESKSEDHLLQSFQCFAIAQWMKDEDETQNRKQKGRFLGIIK